MTTTLDLAQQLIAIPSLTPFDKGCQQLLADRLARVGFTLHSLPSGPVDNLLAIYGDSGPIFAFAGHTDIVPVGNESDWHSHPFQPTVVSSPQGDKLRGRGAQDMKGAIAAMVTACERLVSKKRNLNGRLALLITSGEEGHDYLHGTPVMLDYLKKQGETIRWCVVGEPSSQLQVGDTIRNGRRGSLKAFLTIQGKQGHVAYPDLADNPIHAASAFLQQLTEIEWCQGNEHFPPTVMQCAYIGSNTQTINIIPGELSIGIAFRYSSALDHETIQQKFSQLLFHHDLDHDLTWELSGAPFLTQPGALIEAVDSAVQQVKGFSPKLSTSGGTSDGRFIAPTGAEVIELGTCNDSIHQVNEAVGVTELDELSELYELIAEKMLGPD